MSITTCYNDGIKNGHAPCAVKSSLDFFVLKMQHQVQILFAIRLMDIMLWIYHKD